MKRQVPWPLQQAQHMVTMVIWVVLVARMALVTAGPGDAISPGVPGDPGDLASPRGPSTVGESGGTTSAIPQIRMPKHQGLVEMLHPGPGSE